MFLTESVKPENNIYLNEATAEPSYMYEAILEANEAYHDICMKMIKCEHHCIINEDVEMLKEAEEEAKKSFGEVLKNLWEKFKAFCSKMYDTMLQGLTKAAKFLAIAKAENGKGKMVKIGAIMSDYLKFAKNTEDNLNGIIAGDYVKAGRASQVIARSGIEVDAGASFNNAVAYINVFKPTVQKVKAIRTANLKSTEEPEVVKAAVSNCTKAINGLRHGLMDALKVIYACSSMSPKANKNK